MRVDSRMKEFWVTFPFACQIRGTLLFPDCVALFDRQPMSICETASRFYKGVTVEGWTWIPFGRERAQCPDEADVPRSSREISTSRHNQQSLYKVLHPPSTSRISQLTLGKPPT